MSWTGRSLYAQRCSRQRSANNNITSSDQRQTTDSRRLSPTPSISVMAFRGALPLFVELHNPVEEASRVRLQPLLQRAIVALERACQAAPRAAIPLPSRSIV